MLIEKLKERLELTIERVKKKEEEEDKENKEKEKEESENDEWQRPGSVTKGGYRKNNKMQRTQQSMRGWKQTDDERRKKERQTTNMKHEKQTGPSTRRRNQDFKKIHCTSQLGKLDSRPRTN